MLDRRARRTTPVRANLARAVAEARQDLAYRPRLRRTRLARRAVPFIAVALTAILSADIVILSRMSDQSQNRALVRQTLPGAVRADGGFVASAGEAKIEAPPVAPLAGLRKPALFVVAKGTLDREVVRTVRAQRGVRAVEVADAAGVEVDGKRVPTMGVNPSTFRAYTPEQTARADTLWSNIASGDVAVSFELGNDGGLALGSTVATASGQRLRVGAYATVGMGSMAAIVSRDVGRSLHLIQGNALVVSAPKVDTAKLRRILLKVLPEGTQVATINPVLPVRPRGTTGVGREVVWPASAFLSPPQLDAALTAAQSKLGQPYVWGAEGPDTFDCSGLVQWAYGQAGVRMPRVAAQQWASGPQISLNQAQRGDLLFWRNDPTNPNYISHVAIFWGDGQMLHAPRTGDVVRMAAINTKNLAGVVRVSPQVAQRVR